MQRGGAVTRVGAPSTTKKRQADGRARTPVRRGDEGDGDAALCAWCLCARERARACAPGGAYREWRGGTPSVMFPI